MSARSTKLIVDDRIKTPRVTMAATPDNLAEMLDLPPGHPATLESGSLRVLLRALENVSRALKVSPGYFLKTGRGKTEFPWSADLKA